MLEYTVQLIQNCIMTSILLIILLSLAGDSLSARLPYIIGGGLVGNIIYWPWQGAVQQRFGDHICGCSLISNIWAITSASCVSSPPYDVTFGNIDRRTGVRWPVDQIIIHENYGDGTGLKPNDIAVMRFSPLDLNDQIKPVKLVRTNEEANTNCWITGWGYVGVGQYKIFPNILRQAQVYPMTLQICRSYLGSTLINNEHICAGLSDAGICGGDIGGPLVCYVDDSYQLVGIASWADPYCYTSKPSVFTRINSFREWIKRITLVE